MPLPLLLIGAAALVGGYGVKKGIDAYSDSEKASDLNQAARGMFDDAKEDLECARDECRERLENLGRLKFDLWDRQLGRAVSLLERIRNVELRGAAKVDTLGATAFSTEELAKMKEVSMLASEAAAGGGLAALGSGALVGMASYGGAAMFATASTGTAISSLAGVAATNATLAWFGGGSLAAGGLGIAGGTAVLGGIVAAPVLAVGGIALAAQARKKLAAARATHAEAKKAVSEMRAAVALLRGIDKAASQAHHVLMQLDERMDPVLDDLERMARKRGGTLSRLLRFLERRGGILSRLSRLLRFLERRRIDYATLADNDKRKVYLATVFARGLRILLDAPLLTRDGALAPTYSKTLARGRALIATEA